MSTTQPKVSPALPREEDGTPNEHWFLTRFELSAVPREPGHIVARCRKCAWNLKGAKGFLRSSAYALIIAHAAEHENGGRA